MKTFLRLVFLGNGQRRRRCEESQIFEALYLDSYNSNSRDGFVRRKHR
jgi:hypothetical protein